MEVSDLELFPLESAAPMDFRCARAEQNDFLHSRSVSDQAEGFSVTYLGHFQGVAVSFMTLAMDAIKLQTSEKPRSDIKIVRFPAVKVAQLGVDERWDRRGIGRHMISLAVAIALELRGRIGCRYLTVDAKADVVSWYQSQEFKINKIARKERERIAAERQVAKDSLPLSMRLDLASFIADLHDRYPQDFPRHGEYEA